MPRIKYEDWTPGRDALAVIREANAICADYARQGYDLTLRQLYYQFVARGLIPNKQQSYNRLGSIINKARLAGLLDWSYITDRTRNLESVSHWDDPAASIRGAAQSFRLDKWDDQPARVEVWVEKEALAGVVEQVATRNDVAYFACRGYVSQSELWAAGRRHLRYLLDGQRVVVLHLGDHDPSGIDMTRDIRERLERFVFQDYLNDATHGLGTESVSYEQVRLSIIERLRELTGTPIEVRRIALNMDQVQAYNPPPNPAKLTDSRVAGYLENYGDESWELDALDPSTLDALIEEHILAERDEELWEATDAEEDRHIELLTAASDRWSELVEVLDR